MKRRKFIAVGFVALAALVFAIAAGGVSGATKAKSITVWLQVDAQSGWPDVVAAANSQFQAAHPGVSVNVQYQTWPTHLQKFDATLAAGNSPDVIEMGNTEMTKYMAAGAFQDLTADKSTFANSSTWLAGLAASGRYNGHLYGVPYYAGSRVVTYRTDLFKKAGIKVPSTLGQFATDASILNKKFGKTGFSPVYIAGEDWYVAMGFVFDYGGNIATRISGKWKGALDSAKSVAGLTAFKNFFNTASKASRTTIETQPNPYDVFAQGLAASMIGPAWFTCCVKPYTGVAGQFVMPSHTKGQVMPGFLGGSDLAVPVGADKALGEDWIRDFTSNSAEKSLETKGNIPNSTSLFNPTKINERAAARSWFVPTAKHWVDVENGNVLRTMLAEILTNKLTVKQAAQAASDNIASILNAS
ncbi:MAG TPA: extracellular solute-binding protein [Gaiellaceae bacterium]|nr:extracellular solute-binding protein [Gaiellaceae bacterium]